MSLIRVTKEFTFEMAHALWNYDGSCSNIHGHSYHLSVTVIGLPSNNQDDPKNGMVVDFGHLKKLVQSTIIQQFDHALLVSDNTSLPENLNKHQMFSKLNYVPFQPTCENLLSFIAKTLIPLMPDGMQLHSLKLRETATSYAEWYASDNTN